MFGLTRSNNYLSNYNPFREIENFERNAFGDFFHDQSLAEFKTDLSDEGDHYLLEADLPGFDKNDLSLELQDNMLTIKAQRHSKLEDKDNEGKIIRMERSYGSYSRSFDVTGVDVDKISAKYENGVLQLELPKLSQPQNEVRQLEIH